MPPLPDSTASPDDQIRHSHPLIAMSHSSSPPSVPNDAPAGGSGCAVPKPVLDADERKLRKMGKRRQRHEKKIYLTARADDQKRFRCPSLVPHKVKNVSGRVQCAALHSRDGLLDHMCVYFVSFVVSCSHAVFVSELPRIRMRSIALGISKYGENWSKYSTTPNSIPKCGTA